MERIDGVDLRPQTERARRHLADKLTPAG